MRTDKGEKKISEEDCVTDVMYGVHVSGLDTRFPSFVFAMVSGRAVSAYLTPWSVSVYSVLPSRISLQSASSYIVQVPVEAYGVFETAQNAWIEEEPKVHPGTLLFLDRPLLMVLASGSSSA